MSDLMNEAVDASMRRIVPETIPLRMRIGKNIDRLRSESLTESIELLNQIEMYVWPGPRRGICHDSRMSLALDVGAFDIESILSNRRFLKVYEELLRIPRAEAAALVNAQIGEALATYQHMFEEYWQEMATSVQQRTHVLEDGTVMIRTNRFRISDNVDGTPTFLGMRYQLFSLVMLAGNLRIEGTRSAVLNVLSDAVAQRNRFCAPQTGGEADRYSALAGASLYSRQILATGILLSPDAEADSSLRSLIEDEGRWEVHKMPHYDAEAAPYDLLTRMGGLMPVDHSKGTLNIRIHKPLDDEEFDRICQAAGLQ